MKLSKCQIKYTATTNEVMDDATREHHQEGRNITPATNNYRWFTLTDVDLEVLADGLVRIQGTLKLYWLWWPFFDAPAPDGWPLTTFERGPYNPMRYLKGPTYEVAIPGMEFVTDTSVDIVVPSSLVTGIPAKTEVPHPSGTAGSLAIGV